MGTTNVWESFECPQCGSSCYSTIRDENFCVGKVCIGKDCDFRWPKGDNSFFFRFTRQLVSDFEEDTFERWWERSMKKSEFAAMIQYPTAQKMSAMAAWKYLRGEKK